MTKQPWGCGQLAIAKVLNISPSKVINFTGRKRTRYPELRNAVRHFGGIADDRLTVIYGGWDSVPLDCLMREVHTHGIHWWLRIDGKLFCPSLNKFPHTTPPLRTENVTVQALTSFAKISPP